VGSSRVQGNMSVNGGKGKGDGSCSLWGSLYLIGMLHVYDTV